MCFISCLVQHFALSKTYWQCFLLWIELLDEVVGLLALIVFVSLGYYSRLFPFSNLSEVPCISCFSLRDGVRVTCCLHMNWFALCTSVAQQKRREFWKRVFVLHKWKHEDFWRVYLLWYCRNSCINVCRTTHVTDLLPLTVPGNQLWICHSNAQVGFDLPRYWPLFQQGINTQRGGVEGA